MFSSLFPFTSRKWVALLKMVGGLFNLQVSRYCLCCLNCGSTHGNRGACHTGQGFHILNASPFKFIFNWGARPPSLFACFSEVLHPFPLAKGKNLGGSHYQKVALPCEDTWSPMNGSQRRAEKKPIRLQRKCSGGVPCEAT